MVVLEGGGMLTNGSNQYLQPDYLSPLPTTLDAKKSPLALLAQTCSQIGADSPASKPLLPPLDKPKKESKPETPPAPKEKARSSPAGLAFKPYEANVLTKKSAVEEPSHKEEEKKSSSRVPSRKSATATPPSEAPRTPAERTKSASPATSGASPIIRSGLEVLQSAGAKESALSAYKAAAALCSGCPPGLEQTNPAFRPPYAGGYPHHHGLLGYPGPYVSYARVKTSNGGEALVPVCKDPYCAGCQLSAPVSACPGGCSQCEHQKMGLASLLPPPAPLAAYQRPYVCSWIAGDAYCGKRFSSSEELLQHLRTHTSMVDPSALSLLPPPSMLASPSALHRYPNPPLSPLSARYHPYSKPTGLPALAASPFSAFNPTALGPYYSPYALYGQRIGAAVHP